MVVLAAEATQLTKDLQNSAAIRFAVGVVMEEKHHADLLSIFVSRRRMDCNRFVTEYQAAISGNLIYKRRHHLLLQ